MRNRRATSQNDILFSARPFRILDSVRPCRIQLHKENCRTPWLPPFVLCVRCNCMSADRTIKSEDGGSQDERAISLRREISIDCTVSRIHQPAREVRVSVAPDFRLHPSSGFGLLSFCQLGQTKWLRTDPSKTPLKTKNLLYLTGYNSLKRFGGVFEGNLSSEKVPLKKQYYKK